MARTRKKKQVVVKTYKNCENCHSRFEQKKSWAKFCKPKCRYEFFKKNATYTTVCPKCLEAIEIFIRKQGTAVKSE